MNAVTSKAHIFIEHCNSGTTVAFSEDDVSHLWPILEKRKLHLKDSALENSDEWKAIDRALRAIAGVPQGE